MRLPSLLRRLAAALAVMAGAAVATPALAADPIVSTAWLQDNLKNPKVRVIEVSVEPGQFERGHIPGAVNLVWHTDLVDTVRRDIASKEKVEALLSKAGVGPDTTIVLYGDNNNWFAAWGAWVLDVYGVKDVRLLDGGRKKWELERRELSTRPAQYQAAGYAVTRTNPQLRARLADVLKVAEGDTGTRLLDIRSPDEYAGRIFAPKGSQELAIRAGHIPGAVNVPWASAVNPEDGTFKPKEELRRIYAAAGVDGSKPVIVYCRIGERSSHTWFVLSKLLGYQVRQYDGSWTEYGNAVGVPVNNPAGTVWGAT